MNHCIRHYEEPVAGICRTCQSPFCDRCLVYSFGPTKPPFCVGCALNASGVRSGAKVPRVSTATEVVDGSPTAPQETGALARRTARAERRASKAEARAARKDPTPAPAPVLVADLQPSDTFVPAPGQLAPHRYDPAALDQLV